MVPNPLLFLEHVQSGVIIHIYGLKNRQLSTGEEGPGHEEYPSGERVDTRTSLADFFSRDGLHVVYGVAQERIYRASAMIEHPLPGYNDNDADIHSFNWNGDCTGIPGAEADAAQSLRLMSHLPHLTCLSLVGLAITEQVAQALKDAVDSMPLVQVWVAVDSLHTPCHAYQVQRARYILRMAQSLLGESAKIRKCAKLIFLLADLRN